ncbi:transcriptional activator of ethanol catabolism AlcS [Aspergillus fischeri NRRL 181]|uniref:Acetate transporter, putative n=1 Tax=Neosartorya fischeri (strain ATCC 1020 / DSM 3700 / CBS 544.65 / FGSC A1164 / JCM 1740 / NRRL 181 / WB 181) TaxID=331117 RepID=A1D8X8_NEOFI|nr:Acetate transporter, putative [Aspergillus fischeri NRRL 181]EAW20839.1 Acetate transporter, putative [Aspergillus fischeri NRRL 181]
MDTEQGLKNYTKPSPQDETAMPSLTTIPTSVTLSAEQFEKLYLSPLTQRQGMLSKQMGNPTPLALGGFVITTTPLSCCLMGWRGATGAGIAFTGPIIFLGGGLLVLTSILEFILGNTFPCVVFGTIGAFWFAFGCTMTPAFNAAEPAFLFIWMGVLMLIFLICATRTNAVYVAIFTTLTLVFIFLTGAYWRLAVADALVGNRLIVAAGASLFVASMLGFYLLVAQLFDSVGLPVRLPVGDLSRLWDRRASGGQDPEYGAGAGEK